MGVGGYGKSCNGEFSIASVLGESAEASALSIPNSKPLPSSKELLLYNITLVEAFSLNIYFIRINLEISARNDTSRQTGCW